MEPVKTIEHNGLTIEIHHDISPENPREEWDNLSTFAFFHRNFKNESDIKKDEFTSFEDLEEHIEKTLKAVCVPVYVYQHGGTCIRTSPFSCPWDSGPLGYAFITKERAREEFGWKRITKEREEQLAKYIEGEVETFNQYVSGDVYGFITKKGDEEIDSCWGFYGEDYCIEQAKENCPEVAAA